MRVAVTGAAGRIGRVVHRGLANLGHQIIAMDVAPADDIRHVDVRDTAALVPLLRGCAGVVHLAANPNETSFEEALDSHLRLTHSVLEAMLAAGVPRIVYASSNHAVGFTPRAPNVTVETRARPDSFYGFGKASSEALCSLYHDRHGLAIACLRIGSFRTRPGNRRELSTWLSIAIVSVLRPLDWRVSELRKCLQRLTLGSGLMGSPPRGWARQPGRATR